MHTEEQAKELWCPAARVIDDLSESAASTRLRAHNTRCIASQCMWWRWGETWVVKETGELSQPGVTYTTDEIEVKFGVHGFCGQAGEQT